MKSVRYLSSLLTVCFLAGCMAPPEPAKPINVGPPIEAPCALDGAMLTLTVSDLHGFLDESGAVASHISPMMGGPMLKTMLGSKLGDPQLAGFAPSNGLAVVMLDPSSVFAVAEVQPAQMTSYTETLKAMGLAVKEQNGLLFFAKNAEAFSSAEVLAAAIQEELLSANRRPSLRLSMKPAALIAENEGLIAAGLEKMSTAIEQSSGPEQMTEAQSILEAEMQVLLSIGRQVDTVEVELVPVEGTVNLNKTIQPVAGSRLAAYCNAPAIKDFHPQIHSGLLPDGAINVEYCMRNPQALIDFLNGELTHLSDAMDLDSAVTEQWSEYISSWMGFGSTICESIFAGAEQPFGVAFIEDVNDEEAALEAFRAMSNDLDTLGVLGLYESMGMPMTVAFKENVREIAGVQVHRLTLEFSFENMPAEQRELMVSLMKSMSYDVVIHEHVLICMSGGDGEIEKMINQLKGTAKLAEPLAARSVFPAGGFYYADFDVGGYFELISSITKTVPEAAPIFNKFTQEMAGAKPIVLSGYRNSGRLKFSSQIPADLLVRFAQFGQMMVVQAMQNKAPMPTEQIQEPAGPAPDGTLNLLDGSSVDISSHEGQNVVVLDFWASWCGPCRKGLPMVQAVADHFFGRDVVFYAVNMKEDADTVKKFFADAGLSLPVALDDGTLGKTFEVKGIPHTVVIGKDGNICGVHTGLDSDLDAKLTAQINSALAAEID